MKRVFLTLSIFAMLTLSVKAFDTTPLQISVWPPNFQIVPDDFNVSGLKINLPFGGNENIAGIDVGLASTSTNTSALQVNAFVNRSHDTFAGLQIALLNQAGNSAGISAGLMNITDDKAKGLQVGVINSALEMRGIQIGLINYCEVMTGLQIGLANIITESVVCFFPIINFCF